MAQSETSTLKQARFILWALVIVAGLVATAFYVFAPPQRPLGLNGTAFALTTTSGEAFTEQNLRGAPSLVFFGYTYCPDVCPTTLAESVGWRQSLELTPDQLRIVFVTVDPERDTAEGLGTYLGAFGPDIVGLRGDLEATETAKKAFGVFAEKVEDASSTEYLVDHTASVFMIGAEGSFEGTISFGESRDTALAKIRRLVGS